MSVNPSTNPNGPRRPFDPARNAARPNGTRTASSQREAEAASDFLADTMAQIEESTLRNPLAAVAIAAGAGFLLSKVRADKVAWRLGLFPAIAGVAAGYLSKR